MTKADLVAIIHSQFSKWPESTFNPSKIKKDALKEAILANSFTITEAVQVHGESYVKTASRQVTLSLQFPAHQ